MLRSLKCFARPPLRPANAKPEGHIYVLIGMGIAAIPVALSFMKGVEKRKLWPPTAASIVDVQSSEHTQAITYHYEVAGKRYEHVQRNSKRTDTILPYKVGDEVYVHVHPRNPVSDHQSVDNCIC
jgi:hypothetical protein